MKLPFFPGFDDEAYLSLYEYPEPEVWAVEEKLSSIEELCNATGLSDADLYFDQESYEQAAKSTWIKEWGKSAPESVVESVVADTGGRFNPNAVYASVTLKEGWQGAMSAFMQDNEKWLKENCGLSSDFDKWPKYLFEDQNESYIADMIGFMMLRDNDNIQMDLVGAVFNNVSIDSFVLINEDRLEELLNEGDEPDEEIRVLDNVKKWYEALTANGSAKDGSNSSILDSIRSLVSDMFMIDWYENYIGTKKIIFDGPTNYKETGEITCTDIDSFMSGLWGDFCNYRLLVGHTERQDRFTSFMRNYPQEILDWMGTYSIPCSFYKGLANGGEYELYGCTKDEFLYYVRNDSLEELEDEGFEYAAVLEEEFGIDYAVDYLLAMNWVDLIARAFIITKPTVDFLVDTLARAIDNNNNVKALKSLAYFYMASDHTNYHRDMSLSIKLMSRLSDLWKKGLISDDWLTDDDHGLTSLVDFEWGDDFWFVDEYPDCPDEDDYRIWLLRLLESDFADDIADYLIPLLEMVMEKEKNHNWETGKKAISSFLKRHQTN